MMKKTPLQIKKTQLRQKLVNYVLEHAKKGKLPPERELSEVLGVNRFLLRQSLDELLKTGVIYRKPRQGTFLNHSPLLKTIGIVLAEGQYNAYFDFPLVTAGILETLESYNYMVRSLTFRDLSELPDLMERYGLSSCIWPACGHDSVEKLLPSLPESVLKKLVFICEEPFELENVLSFNYVENSSAAAARVDSVYAAGGRRIAALTYPGGSFDLFRRRVKELGLEWHEDWFIGHGDEIPEKLPRLVKEYGIDSIFSDGAIGMFENLFPTLAKIPDFHPYLSIADDKRVRAFREVYRDKVDVAYLFYANEQKRLGVEAAEMAHRILNSGKVQQPILIGPEIIKDTKTRKRIIR